jgi:hypothetical protein
MGRHGLWQGGEVQGSVMFWGCQCFGAAHGHIWQDGEMLSSSSSSSIKFTAICGQAAAASVMHRPHPDHRSL